MSSRSRADVTACRHGRLRESVLTTSASFLTRDQSSKKNLRRGFARRAQRVDAVHKHGMDRLSEARTPSIDTTASEQSIELGCS